jgi:cytochrome c-type biogenesis protein CcmH
MILFWTVSALLAAGTLFLILRPLLAGRDEAGVSRNEANLAVYRDQLRELEADLAAGTLQRSDYDHAKRELEARLLEDVSPSEAEAGARGGRKAAWAVAAAVPAGALALYLVIGMPEALDPDAASPEVAHGVTVAQIEAMVERLAERMRENPEDGEGWRMLARSYGFLGRFKEAADAYARASTRLPADAQLLADYADVLGMAQGRTLEGEPEKLALRALEIDGTNMKALALAGSAAFERRDYGLAATYWERMLPLVPAGSEDAQSIRANVEEARALAGQQPAAGKSAAAGVSGSVRLSPELAARASPEDTVYIFARPTEGPPAPLAVLRKRVRDLPASFSLDDSLAMTPETRLSRAGSVIIGARVSRSGSATPQPGDLQGFSAPVKSDASGVAVVIDSEVR